MKRREFLTLTGMTGLALTLPTNLLSNFELYPYTKPIWSNINGSTSLNEQGALVYQYDVQSRFHPKSPPPYKYYREVALTDGAPNVTEQDIINEIKSKWNKPDELVTTCGAVAVFGTSGYTILKHMDIKSIKELIDRVKTGQLSRIGRVEAVSSHRYPFFYTCEREGNYLIHTRNYITMDKIRVTKEKLYDLQMFAKEMITGRDGRQNEVNNG